MHLSRRRQNVPTLLLAAVFATAVAPRAFADNKAAADQLYIDAKKLMDDGKAADACPKLEESMRLDPADGTELRLATCYEMIGRYATSWSLYRTALTKAKKANNAQRIEYATAHIAIVEPKISHVTLAVAAGANVPGLVVKLDEDTIGAGAFGTALPVDPGTHRVSVSAPGKNTWETKVEVGPEKTDKSVQIPQLQDAPATVPMTTAKGGVPTLAYVSIGAGVVFLAGAVVGQLSARSAFDDRKNDCAAQRTPTCDDTGTSKIHTWETLSFVSAGLSAVGFGVGIYLIASAPKKEDAPAVSSLRVGIMPGSTPRFGIEGAF
jgi:hypothetical protein